MARLPGVAEIPLIYPMVASIPAMVTTRSGLSEKLVTISPESLVTMLRNDWSPWSGIRTTLNAKGRNASVTVGYNAWLGSIPSDVLTIPRLAYTVLGVEE